jgi:superfamily I DNA/RNA helicase
MNVADVGDAGARRAIDAPLDAPLLAITGPAASGKSKTLALRYAALLAREPELAAAEPVVAAPRAASARQLGERIAALVPAARERRYVGITLDALAFDLLRTHATATGLALDLRRIDDADAEAIFERAAAPLFSADWADYLGAEIDPEIPGLRAPDRFATATLRLIRKLRDAHIGPDDFLTAALRGAASFYANPPNLAAPALLFATKDEHRSSLSVDAAERERQRRRELDLAKIVAKLYRSYLDELAARGALTPGDAIAEATRLLDAYPNVASAERRRLRLALIDDVHDLHAGEFRFLQALFGKALAGVTVAGNADDATETFAGARPERVFNAAATTVRLGDRGRIPAQIVAAAQAIRAADDHAAIPSGDAVRLHRARDRAAEAEFVADSIAELIAGGTAPGAIAVVHRSARTLTAIEDALVDRNVAVALNGDAALLARHETLDALAVLSSALDPFRHDRLLRVLQLPHIALNDATLALLCGEPASAQALLFDLPEIDETDGRRWDRRRDLRLGTNVVRGDRDADLDPGARARLAAFRARRSVWQTFARDATPADAAGAILRDAGLFESYGEERTARTRRRISLLQRLLALIADIAERDPAADLAEVLARIDEIARGESGPELSDTSPDAVAVASIDRIKHRRFEHVFVVDVRAGSFPPYYVPDAFLFSPTYGMIPKDSVGDALTARTAKFTWYQHHAKLRETYAREDRRALAVAMTRADRRVTISAGGKPTRGIAAPELLAELERFRPMLADAPLPQPALPIAAPATLAGTDRPPVPARPATRIVALELAAALATCIRCAPRRALVSALAVRTPLDHTDGGERIVHVSSAAGKTILHGRVALIERDERTYVCVHPAEAATVAALALDALGPGVERDVYFVRTDDGSLDGPHAVDGSLAERALDALAGRFSPICHSCAE